ncbi:MAG: hypothetical protein LBB35_01440 [Coriobacteriaceae bacterium]|jgi:hypothetical protein|nr:hypothetical protein [Coriobacteriaceae bacterium]
MTLSTSSTPLASASLVSRHFVFIGGGKMGEAMIGGWIASAENPLTTSLLLTLLW